VSVVQHILLWYSNI